MTRHKDSYSPDPDAVVDHYASGYEASRLHAGTGQIDRERSRELFQRFLPQAPVTILDVGGGPGGHACWLAKQGYEVHLIDISPLHVQLAQEASQRQPEAPLASANIGDACSLPWNAGTVDAVLLFGPLYHLTDRKDRLEALREAHRVLAPGGVLLAAGISRFASTFDGLRKGFLKDPQFAGIVDQDMKCGQHRNPTNHPEYFMDTFFHHPDELRREIAEAGFAVRGVFGVEGPGWLVPDFAEWWDREEYRELLLRIARAVETEPSLLGVSAHLVVVGEKPEDLAKPLPIVTERLVLRRYTRDDIPDVLAFASQPSVAKITHQRIPATEEGVRRYIDLQNSYQPFEEDRVFELAMERKEDGRVIGLMGFIRHGDQQGEMGWALGAEYRGQGYATEAARALIDYGFHSLGLHRIHADTNADNLASWRVMERLGMRREGILRGAVCEDGKWMDRYLYGILNE